ncbi:MAG: hypothetical protein QOJ68_3730, partial [Blastococcus sp.]|nr:hypothetical protein [Blastococcus sp.]
ASTCSGRTRDGPQPNRPSAGSRSVGIVGLVTSTALYRACVALGVVVPSQGRQGTLVGLLRTDAPAAAGASVGVAGTGEAGRPTDGPPGRVAAAGPTVNWRRRERLRGRRRRSVTER